MGQDSACGSCSGEVTISAILQDKNKVNIHQSQVVLLWAQASPCPSDHDADMLQQTCTKSCQHVNPHQDLLQGEAIENVKVPRDASALCYMIGSPTSMHQGLLNLA